MIATVPLEAESIETAVKVKVSLSAITPLLSVSFDITFVEDSPESSAIVAVSFTAVGGSFFVLTI